MAESILQVGANRISMAYEVSTLSASNELNIINYERFRLTGGSGGYNLGGAEVGLLYTASL